MVVAQLVERSLLILDVRGSNPVISEIYIEHLLTCLPSNVLKDEKNEKESGNGPLFLKKHIKLWKDENKPKEAGNGPLSKTYLIMKWQK